MDSTIELLSHGHTATETLSYDAMDMRGWYQRTRAVHDAPPSILAAYVPLASTIFAKQCQHVASGDTNILAMGDVGLGLALDERRNPTISTEATALVQLISTPGEPQATPHALKCLHATWTSGQCLFLFNPATGWRGTFAEHRLWSALLLSDGQSIKTPYCKPVVRAWHPLPILEDLKACLGETVEKVASKIAEIGFDGAPDLVLYRPDALWFVEVKSATDRLRENQVEMIRQLSRIPSVKCSICCPASARKRMAEAMMEDSDGYDSP